MTHGARALQPKSKVGPGQAPPARRATTYHAVICACRASESHVCVRPSRRASHVSRVMCATASSAWTTRPARSMSDTTWRLLSRRRMILQQSSQVKNYSPGEQETGAGYKRTSRARVAARRLHEEATSVCETARFCDLAVAWDEWSWPSPLFHPLWNDLFAVLGFINYSLKY